MLKRVLAVTLGLMLVLGLSGLALASLNEANVIQTGDWNFTFVGQYSDTWNDAYIEQQGAVVDCAVVVQVSPDNYAQVTQGVHATSVGVALIEQTDPCTYPNVWHTLQEKIEWGLKIVDYYEPYLYF